MCAVALRLTTPGSVPRVLVVTLCRSFCPLWMCVCYIQLIFLSPCGVSCHCASSVQVTLRNVFGFALYIDYLAMSIVQHDLDGVDSLILGTYAPDYNFPVRLRLTRTQSRSPIPNPDCRSST